MTSLISVRIWSSDLFLFQWRGIIWFRLFLFQCLTVVCVNEFLQTHCGIAWRKGTSILKLWSQILFKWSIVQAFFRWQYEKWLLQPLLLGGLILDSLRYGVGWGRGRLWGENWSMNALVSLEWGEKMKSDCVYSVVEKENSCNNNPLETDIWQ